MVKLSKLRPSLGRDESNGRKEERGREWYEFGMIMALYSYNYWCKGPSLSCLEVLIDIGEFVMGGMAIASVSERKTSR
jgi:hypothetical protein